MYDAIQRFLWMSAVLIITLHGEKRMLYPCKAHLKLRYAACFKRHGQRAESLGHPLAGVKRKTPLCFIMNLPEAPVDAMHPVFLGSAKVLTKAFKTRIPKECFPDFEKRLSTAKCQENFCINLALCLIFLSGKLLGLQNVFLPPRAGSVFGQFCPK